MKLVSANTVPSTENLQSLSRLFNIPLETLLDDTAEAEPAAAPEKLPAEEQAKEEGKGQGLGKDRRYKAIVMVIVLLAILLTTAVLAHRRTASSNCVSPCFFLILLAFETVPLFYLQIKQMPIKCKPHTVYI